MSVIHGEINRHLRFLVRPLSKWPNFIFSSMTDFNDSEDFRLLLSLALRGKVLGAVLLSWLWL